jgi:thiamine monophosphate synthase
VAGPDPLGGDAVHLPSAGPYPPPELSLVGRSCHDADEVERLSTEDYLTVSPIHRTATKPGYGPALGPRRAGDLAAGAGVPWLALGGVDSPERAAACVAAGAAGVAVLGCVMRAADPESVVRDLGAACAGVRA